MCKHTRQNYKERIRLEVDSDQIGSSKKSIVINNHTQRVEPNTTKRGSAPKSKQFSRTVTTTISKQTNQTTYKSTKVVGPQKSEDVLTTVNIVLCTVRTQSPMCATAPVASFLPTDASGQQDTTGHVRQQCDTTQENNNAEHNKKQIQYSTTQHTTTV